MGFHSLRQVSQLLLLAWLILCNTDSRSKWQMLSDTAQATLCLLLLLILLKLQQRRQRSTQRRQTQVQSLWSCLRYPRTVAHLSSVITFSAQNTEVLSSSMWSVQVLTFLSTRLILFPTWQRAILTDSAIKLLIVLVRVDGVQKAISIQQLHLTHHLNRLTSALQIAR
jgi:hypothetical protein